MNCNDFNVMMSELTAFKNRDAGYSARHISKWTASVMYMTIVSLFLSVSCTTKDQPHSHQHTYTCPMHPEIQSDKPGSCPICGMDLVLKDRKDTTTYSGLSSLSDASIISDVATIRTWEKSVPVVITAQGIVTYDARNTYTISTRSQGRLEKVYIRYAYQKITKGQQLAELYSSEAVAAQRELIYLLENDAKNTSLIASAKHKLLILGMSEAQLHTLSSTRTVQETITVYSPYNGYVTMKKQRGSAQQKSVVPSSMSEMGPSVPPEKSFDQTTPEDSEIIREGTYVSAGQALFYVVNPSSLRIEADIPSSQASFIRKNDAVLIDTGNHQVVKASIDLVEPLLAEDGKFIKTRIRVNASGLKPGQFVTVTVHSKPVDAIWVPRSAVLEQGLSKIVFVKQQETFVPKTIQTGILLNDALQIVSGLSPGDEIASDAGFLQSGEN